MSRYEKCSCLLQRADGIQIVALGSQEDVTEEVILELGSDG